jgi:hypothetical protein
MAWKPPLGCQKREEYLRERIEVLSRTMHEYINSDGSTAVIARSILIYVDEFEERVHELIEITSTKDGEQ